MHSKSNIIHPLTKPSKREAIEGKRARQHQDLKCDDQHRFQRPPVRLRARPAGGAGGGGGHGAG